MSDNAVLNELSQRHQATLDGALRAMRTREFFTPYPENPKRYGDDPESDTLSATEGKAAFESLLGTGVDLHQPGEDGTVGPDPSEGGEVSPYGVDLRVRYAHLDVDTLLPATRVGLPDWRRVGPHGRAAVCLEVLSRINARTHLFAHAVMHTSGQGYTMAFQAGGTHAQDRGLEAVTYAYAAQTQTPDQASWVKPQGKRPELRMEKTFTPVGRGVSLLVGCNTFPTWNGYPGLFASLAAGNAVVVKPHPRAVLPLALTVRIAREVLAEAGLDPNLVTLAPEYPGEGLAKSLSTRGEVRIVDYTGSTAFGDWLEEHAAQAQVYTEKAGVNLVLLDSTDDYRGMLANLAFSLSLYSGQMCTTPQNLLIPRDGIATDQGRRGFDEVADDLSTAVDNLLGDDARASALLGAVVNPQVLDRVERAGDMGRLVHASRAVAHPEFQDATVRTPALVAVDATKEEDRETFSQECFGPVAFLVAVDSTSHAVDSLRRSVQDHGAMTVSAYCTDETVERDVEEACLDVGATLSVNLTDGVYVNQTAAFSDFHGSGANPAANAVLCDMAFVANRFRTIEVRRHA